MTSLLDTILSDINKTSRGMLTDPEALFNLVKEAVVNPSKAELAAKQPDYLFNLVKEAVVDSSKAELAAKQLAGVLEPPKISYPPVWAVKLEITPQEFAEIQQETRELLKSSKIQFDYSMKWLEDLAEGDRMFYARRRAERQGLVRSTNVPSHADKMRAELSKSRSTRPRKSSEDYIPHKKPAPILSLRENVKLISKKRK
jgi:hypothetical protein